MRIRANFVRGQSTNNPLAADGTTLNSAGLADLPAVAGGDVAVIALDPDAANGDPEIVYVTAHEAGAISATIVRAREGTIAREHLSGTTWVHGPTVHDFTRIARTAAYVAGDLDASEAAFRLDDTATRPQLVVSAKDSAGALKHGRLPAAGAATVWLARDFTLFLAANNTLEQTARSVVIPGGAMGPNGMLKITLFGETFGIGGNKHGRFYFGGELFRDLLVGSSVNNARFGWSAYLANANSEAVQEFFAFEAEMGNAMYPISGGGGLVDTTVDRTLEFKVQKAIANDGIRVHGWLVELIQ